MSELRREYEEATKKRHDLEILISQRIAGTAEAHKQCPTEKLKQHLSALNFYIRALEERLKYEE